MVNAAPRPYGDPIPLGPPRRGPWLERFDSWLRRHRWFPDTLFAAVLAIFLLPFTLVFMSGMGASSTDIQAVDILLLLVPVFAIHASVALRRVFPITTFAIVVVSLAIKVMITGVPFGTDLIFLLALYTLCAYAPRPWPTLGLLTGLAGAAIECLRLSFVIRDFTKNETATAVALLLFFFLFMVAAVLAAWGLGQFRRVRYAYFATLEDRTRRAEAEREERAARAVVEERARIAREMHDVVAHSLAVIVSQAQGGQYAARKNPERAAEVLGTIADTSRAALTDMRGLLGVLRSSDSLGPNRAGDTPGELVMGPQPALNQLGDLINRVRGSGLGVERAENGSPRPLGTSGELAVFRLVQESLTNTIKHAGPGATATVMMNWTPDALELSVVDNGTGVKPTDPAERTGGGHGLVGMRERVSVVGGQISTGPRPGGGFGVTARIPYRPVRR